MATHIPPVPPPLPTRQTTRGLPGSPRFEAYAGPLRASAVAIADNPAPAEFCSAVLDRMQGVPGTAGVEDPAVFLGPVPIRGREFPVPAGVAQRVERCRLGTVQQLIDAQLVTSRCVCVGRMGSTPNPPPAAPLYSPYRAGTARSRGTRSSPAPAPPPPVPAERG